MKSIFMPRLGLTMEEGVIVRWHVAQGDHFQQGQMIFEIETDKVTSQVEAPFSGKIVKIVVKEDETAPVGAVVAETE